MMKTFIAIGILLVTSFFVFNAHSQNAPQRPVGLAADKWIPISSNFGFVVTLEDPTPNQASTRGYFVVWQNGKWRSVQTLSPGGLHR